MYNSKMDSTLEARESSVAHNPNEVFSSPLAPKLAADTVFKSFRYSQGDLQTQKLFFKYMHEVAPGWRMDDNLKAETLEASRKSIRAFLYPKSKDPKHLDIGHKTFEEEVKTQVDIMQAVLNGTEESFVEENTDPNTLLIQIAHSMIMSDYKFLIHNGGRPSRGEAAIDRFFSFFRNYILKETSTGNAFFDRMFDDIRKFYDTKGDPDLRWAVKPDYYILEKGIEKPIEALEEMAKIWR